MSGKEQQLLFLELLGLAGGRQDLERALDILFQNAESPFLASPSRISRRVSGSMTTSPVARAVRVVAALSDTSTMLAAPDASR